MESESYITLFMLGLFTVTMIISAIIDKIKKK